MKHLFVIIYKNNGSTLTTENRPQYVEAGELLVYPSEKMVTNALHTLCLDNGIKEFKGAEAIVTLDGNEIRRYKLNC